MPVAKLPATKSLKTTKLTKSWALLLGDRLLYQTDECQKAINVKLKVERRHGKRARLVSVIDKDCSEASERKKRDREMADRERITNPLSDKLSTRQAQALDELHELVGDLFCVTTPKGTSGYQHRGDLRRATNNEAAQAKLSYHGDDLLLDMRKNVGTEAAAKLREFARDVLARARRIELAAKRGAFAKIVKGAYVTKDGKDLYGPEDDLGAANLAMWNKGKHVRRFTDGTESVVDDYETAAETVAAAE